MLPGCERDALRVPGCGMGVSLVLQGVEMGVGLVTTQGVKWDTPGCTRV